MTETEFRVEIWKLLDKCADPVYQAERVLRLEEYERNRTDPWVWYCRACGETGQCEKEQQREDAGMEHLKECQHGLKPTVATDSYGRLKHFWSY